MTSIGESTVTFLGVTLPHLFGKPLVTTHVSQIHVVMVCLKTDEHCAYIGVLVTCYVGLSVLVFLMSPGAVKIGCTDTSLNRSGMGALVFTAYTPLTPMHLDQRCRTHEPRAVSHDLCDGAPLHRCHLCNVISGMPMHTQDPHHRVPLPENHGTGIRAALCHAPRLPRACLSQQSIQR